MSKYYSPKNGVKNKKLTKKEMQKMQEKEEFLRHNRNGVFGSIH